MKPREAEELEAMLASPGWGYFEALVERRFPSSYYRRRVIEALGETNLQQIPLRVAQVEAEYEAVDQILRLPVLRIEELQRLEERHATDRG